MLPHGHVQLLGQLHVWGGRNPETGYEEVPVAFRGRALRLAGCFQVSTQASCFCYLSRVPLQAQDSVGAGQSGRMSYGPDDSFSDVDKAKTLRLNSETQGFGLFSLLLLP